MMVSSEDEGSVHTAAQPILSGSWWSLWSHYPQRIQSYVLVTYDDGQVSVHITQWPEGMISKHLIKMWFLGFSVLCLWMGSYSPFSLVVDHFFCCFRCIGESPPTHSHQSLGLSPFILHLCQFVSICAFGYSKNDLCYVMGIALWTKLNTPTSWMLACYWKRQTWNT